MWGFWELVGFFTKSVGVSLIYVHLIFHQAIIGQMKTHAKSNVISNYAVTS